MGVGTRRTWKNSKGKAGFHEVKAGSVCGWAREQASVNSWHWQLPLKYMGIWKERGGTAASVCMVYGKRRATCSLWGKEQKSRAKQESIKGVRESGAKPEWNRGRKRLIPRDVQERVQTVAQLMEESLSCLWLPGWEGNRHCRLPVVPACPPSPGFIFWFIVTRNQPS